MNPTIRTFGWPDTGLCEWEHWVALVRPAQPTLGSLVLAAKSDATAFSNLPPAAHAELASISAVIERVLHEAVRYEKINYLMLMMTDNEVHFHVIPRYSGSREWNERVFVDVGWPKMPDLSNDFAPKGVELRALIAWLRSYFV